MLLTQAVEPLLSAAIRSIQLASITRVVRKYWLDRDMIANIELADSWSNHIDNSGDLMSHRYRWRLPGERVWCFWYQRCSSSIFMDVCERFLVRFVFFEPWRTTHLYRKCQRRPVECEHVQVRHQGWGCHSIVRLLCHGIAQLSFFYRQLLIS